jgi:Fe-Mn family superoxide dismutase
VLSCHTGHVLHSLLWKNLSPRGGGEPEGELAAAVKEFFGSFTGLNRQLTEATMNIQGSGWGALGWEPLGKRLVVEQVYDHQGNIGNGGVVRSRAGRASSRARGRSAT